MTKEERKEKKEKRREMMKITLDKNRGVVGFLFVFFIFLSAFVIFSCENPFIQSIVDPKTVTFDSNGGSGVEKQTVFKGQAIRRPSDPSRSGFIFEAWFSDNETFLNEWDFAVVPDTNITLYAKWAAIPVDITYTLAQTGGIDGLADSTGIVFTFSASVDSFDLTADDISVSGAAEKGAAATFAKSDSDWLLEPITISEAGLAIVSIAKNGIEAAAKSVLVYSEKGFVPEYWSITWVMNGGTKGAGAYPDQIEKGTALDRPSPDPAKDGNTFDGWYIDIDLITPYDFNAPVDKDITLYAKWTENAPLTYTVTFNSNGGSAVSPVTNVAHGSTITKPADPTRTGYTFEGWYKEAECLVPWDFDTAVTADITLYAKWRTIPGVETFTVTFDKNGGDTEASPPTRTVAHGSLITAPAPPTRTGYTFEGWYKEAALTTAWDFAADAVTANITLYAKWTEDTTPDGTAEKPFLVSNETELRKVGTGTDGWTVSAHYRQTANITMIQGNWTPIGNDSNRFTGTYNGGGYTITGLSINTSIFDIGMFGRIGTGGTVENLGLIDVNITGNSSIGGIAGSNSGTIQNCYVSGSVKGEYYVGGIVGDNSGIIQNCYVIGSVTATGVNGATINNAGGITGNNFVTVRNCVALNESVTNGMNPANIGRVMGEANGTRQNNYGWTGMTLKVDGTTQTPASILGSKDGADITAAEVKTETWWKNSIAWNTTAGSAWDFTSLNSPWVWNSEHSRPVLRNEVPQAWPGYLQ